jgi:threonine/homoserine/homoserine lactone efflux protein
MAAELVIAGLATGIAMTAPLGPVNALVVRTALRRGFPVALLTAAGAVIADLAFATAAAYGASLVERLLLTYAGPLMVAGGAFLAVLGIRMATAHYRPADLRPEEPASRAQILRKFLTAFAMTITNPMTFFGFLAVFATMGSVLRLADSALRPLLVVGGVALGALLWWLLLSLAVDRLRARLSVAVLDRINRWTGVFIAGFGFALLMEVLW